MKLTQLLLITAFTQVPSLSDSIARPAGPHVQAMNWGRFALLKPLPKTKTAKAGTTACDVIWSNVPGVPPTIELAHPPAFAAKLEGGRAALTSRAVFTFACGNAGVFVYNRVLSIFLTSTLETRVRAAGRCALHKGQYQAPCPLFSMTDIFALGRVLV